MEGTLWTEEDLCQIERQGLTLAQVQEQLAEFRAGARYLRLLRPCTIGDGIEVIPLAKQAACVERYETALQDTVVVKFVPASGAATRMFRDWFRYLQEGGASVEECGTLLHDLPRYAFYRVLAAALACQGKDLARMIAEGRLVEILTFLLTPEGFNYGELPKALLPFHAYPEGSRTALEEHLVEAAMYVRDAREVCRVHFTVAPDHYRRVQEELERIKGRYEQRFGVRYLLELSVQEPSTNTIAVDRQNNPFRDEKGRLLFRPGGHGALLTNLDRLDCDLAFIKNIDNVATDRLKPLIAHWKKVLAGRLLFLQDEVFRRVRLLAAGDTAENTLVDTAEFCRRQLSIELPQGFAERPAPERRQFLYSLLDRPLRVCGMVCKEGEPGGGPFWLDAPEGGRSVQIVEEFQVDQHDEEQAAIWRAATHFNPVDLVCGLRDHLGRKFALTRFVDQRAFSITEKTEKGRDIRALELPGLWNGAMAFWNSVFVEVPLETFNPVKTIADLLRPAHLPD